MKKRQDYQKKNYIKKPKPLFLFQLEEYSRLEGKLKQSIAELEKREKQLTINETQVYQTCFLF